MQQHWASGPHAWPVNTREWQAQVFLFQKVYPVTGLAFIPRMADDRDGRWYYGYVQEAVDRVIEDAILHHDVNPDRVYLTDPHLDTGKPVIVSVIGREHARHLFNPNPETGRRSLKERGDPAAIYLDELTVRLRANDETPGNL